MRHKGTPATSSLDRSGKLLSIQSGLVFVYLVGEWDMGRPMCHKQCNY